MDDEYPFGEVSTCVVCGRTTSHMVVNSEGEYIPVCHGECVQRFKGKGD